MNSLKQAIHKVRSFLEPISSPTLFPGTKIYEPEDSDPVAPLKREIIAFAMRVLQYSENELGGESFTHFQQIADDYMDKIDLKLTDPEGSDYFNFMGAVQELIGAGKAL